MPVVPVLSMMSAILLIVSTATKSAWIGTVIVFIIGRPLYAVAMIKKAVTSKHVYSNLV